MSENTSTRSPVRMAVLLALHLAFGVITLWLLLRLVPQYVKIFKDFDVKLPDMTIMVIDLSQLFAKFWFALAPCLGAGDFAIMFDLNRTGHTRLMTTWGVLVCLAAMLLIGLIVQDVFVPFNDLITELSK